MIFEMKFMENRGEPEIWGNFMEVMKIGFFRNFME